MHMLGKQSAFNCNAPESLVVIMAFPLCDIDREPEDSEAPLSLEVSLDEESSAIDLYAEALQEGCVLPLRCACLMECPDAIALMQEVGDVVF